MSASRKGRSAKPVPGASRVPRGNPVSVMLVDDHPLWRDTLRKVLERRRFAVVTAEASDARQAVEMASGARPDVVVMDVQLPDESGIEATRKLLRDIPHAKVLVLASSDNRKQVLEAVEAGACGYLLKTASSEEVREAVRRVHDGEFVFPPRLASIVMDEFRRRSGEIVAASESNRIQKEGDYWTVSFEGSVFRLRDTRGVRYLAHLLHNPGREFHSLDLVALDRGTVSARGGDAGPVLDEQAKTAYRRRLKELEDELEEAESWTDVDRAGRVREEMDALRDQLATAVGLGGRDRRAASNTERARVNVTLAIRSAMGKIGQYAEPLAQHLTSTISTGTYCSYMPDPRVPIAWN